MRKLLLLFLLLPAMAYGQGVYTAASSAYVDVNAVINGPTHVAVNGDVIQIPCPTFGTTVTWPSTLTISANITLTVLNSAPNTGTATFGAGSNCLTIIQNVSTLIHGFPTYNPTNNLLQIQNMIIQPGAGAISTAQNSIAIAVNGTGTSSGMPQLRIDNVQFGNATATWQYANAGPGGATTGEFTIVEDNTVGVADHNTLYTGSHVSMVSVNMTSYLGVGLYGDNSWAQPDSMGGANAFYLENNSTYQQLWPIQETEQVFPNIGGGRAVVRFNHSTLDGTFGYTGGHGLDTTDRTRSVRHVETYGNQLNCINGSGGGQCYDLCIYRGGTGRCFGNTMTLSGGAIWREMLGVSTLRQEGDIWTNIANTLEASAVGMGGCGGGTTFSGGSTWPTGGNAADNAVGPFDLNDGTTYYSGTTVGGTSGTHLVVSGVTWTSNQWSSPSDKFPYSVWDKTQGWVSYATGNGTSSIDVFQSPHGYINGGGSINAASGDVIEIHRSKGCIDGASMGQGALLTGTPPALQSTGLPGPANNAHDPFYEWDDTVPALANGFQVGNADPSAIANETYFTDNSLGSPHVQTSPTSPFNGTSGVGFGTLANRPTTCTPNALSGVSGVGYFATDVGTWNTSGNGFGQGTLYTCTATNTWTALYVPYVYPHPLTTGTPQANAPTFSPSTGTPPQTVTMSCSTSGSIGCYTTNGSTPTATTPGTCDSSPTQTYSSPISVVTNPTTLNGICTAVGYLNSGMASSTYSGTNTCANPQQLAPNYSGVGPGPGGAYYYPPTTLIGFTSPTPGCNMVMTLDGSLPNAGCTISGSTVAYADQNISVTTVMRVRACKAGYADSAVPGGTWTVVPGISSSGITFTPGVVFTGGTGPQ